MGFKEVKKFQKLAGKDFGSLTIHSEYGNNRLKERAMQIAEEFQEVMSAMGIVSELTLYDSSIYDTFYNVQCVKDKKLNKKNILKELCDLTITAESTAVELGLPFDKARKRVDENNLTKVEGGAKFDKNGKVVKPKGYKKVDLSDLV